MTQEQQDGMIVAYYERAMVQMANDYADLLRKYLWLCNENPCPRCHPKNKDA